MLTNPPEEYELKCSRCDYTAVVLKRQYKINPMKQIEKYFQLVDDNLVCYDCYYKEDTDEMAKT